MGSAPAVAFFCVVRLAAVFFVPFEDPAVLLDAPTFEPLTAADFFTAVFFTADFFTVVLFLTIPGLLAAWFAPFVHSMSNEPKEASPAQAGT